MRTSDGRTVVLDMKSATARKAVSAVCVGCVVSSAVALSKVFTDNCNHCQDLRALTGPLILLSYLNVQAFGILFLQIRPFSESQCISSKKMT